MANLKPKRTTLECLTGPDRDFLAALYRHRCLNRDLAHQYFYRKAGCSPEETRARLQELLETHHLLTAVGSARRGPEEPEAEPAFFLSTLGVETVLHLENIPKREQDPETGAWKRTARTAAGLQMAQGSIPHQLGLNRFVLELKERTGDRVSYRYLDSKFMPEGNGSMLPDGMIVFQDTLILLEQDMGSERGKHLERKFLHYRSFLDFPTPFYAGKKIVLLFILDNVTGITRRRNTLWRFMTRYLLDRADGTFEAFANTPEILLDILAFRLLGLENTVGWEQKARETSVRSTLQTVHGFSPLRPNLAERIPAVYHAYMRRLTPQKTIQVFRGRVQEYLLDFWLNGEVSVLHKILYHNRYAQTLARWSRFGRTISYLVIVPDAKWVRNVLVRCGVTDGDTQHVYFTTPERLRKRTFQEALFQIDSLGNLFHFRDLSLKETVFEKTLKAT